jgi:hypothetical protein
MRACADAEELGFRERILRFFPTVFQPRHGKEAGGAILEPVENVLKYALREAKIELISPKEAQKTISPVKLETGLFRQKKLKSRRFLFRVHPGEHGFYASMSRC